MSVMRLLLCYPYGRRGGATPMESVDQDVATLVHPEDQYGWPGAIDARDPTEYDEADLWREIARHARPGDLLVPMSEEAILPCAYAALVSAGQYRSVHSWPTALALTDRVVQRRALDVTPYNPSWSVLQEPIAGTVVRQRRSIRSRGVALSVRPDMSGSCSWGLKEQEAPGEQFEVTGICGPLPAFCGIARQVWSSDGTRIERYEAITDRFALEGLDRFVEWVLGALGVRLGVWNIEFRYLESRYNEGAESRREGLYTAIEVNGRPGWEPGEGYEAYLERDPIDLLVRWWRVAKAVR